MHQLYDVTNASPSVVFIHRWVSKESDDSKWSYQILQKFARIGTCEKLIMKCSCPSEVLQCGMFLLLRSHACLHIPSHQVKVLSVRGYYSFYMLLVVEHLPIRFDTHRSIGYFLHGSPRVVSKLCMFVVPYLILI